MLVLHTFGYQLAHDFRERKQTRQSSSAKFEYVIGIHGLREGGSARDSGF